jgi:DNA-binding response OmpR family regulator
MMIRCPHCGRCFENKPTEVNGNILNTLTGREAQVFKLLWKSQPEAISTETIIERLHIGHHDAPERNVWVILKRLRNKLEPTTLHISRSNRWAGGYRLMRK